MLLFKKNSSIQLLLCLSVSFFACKKDDTKGVSVGGGISSQEGLPNNFGLCKIAEEDFFSRNDSIAYRRINYHYTINGEIDFIIWSNPKYQLPYYDSIAFVKNRIQNVVYKLRNFSIGLPDTINSYHFDYQNQLKKIVSYSDSGIVSTSTFFYGQLNKPSSYSIENKYGRKGKVQCLWQQNNMVELRVVESNFPTTPVGVRIILGYDDKKNPYQNGYYFDKAFWSVFSQNNVISQTEYQADGSILYDQNIFLSYHANYPISFTEKVSYGNETTNIKYICN